MRHRGSLGGREADGEQGVGAEARLVLGAVHLDHQAVDVALRGGVDADELGSEAIVDVGHGVEHALAEVGALVAVTQLAGLVDAGRGTRGDRGAAFSAVIQADVDFDGGIAARVDDLAGADVFDVRRTLLFRAADWPAGGAHMLLPCPAK